MGQQMMDADRGGITFVFLLPVLEARYVEAHGVSQSEATLFNEFHHGHGCSHRLAA